MQNVWNCKNRNVIYTRFESVSKVGEVIQANYEVHPIKTLTCSAH